MVLMSSPRQAQNPSLLNSKLQQPQRITSPRPFTNYSLTSRAPSSPPFSPYLPISKPMASFLLPRSRPLFALTLGLGLSSVYATQTLYRQKPLLCEASGAKPMTTISDSFKTYSQDAKVPVFKDGRPNPQAYGQISAGSIAGTFVNPSLEYVC